MWKVFKLNPTCKTVSLHEVVAKRSNNTHWLSFRPLRTNTHCTRCPAVIDSQEQLIVCTWVSDSSLALLFPTTSFTCVPSLDQPFQTVLSSFPFLSSTSVLFLVAAGWKCLRVCWVYVLQCGFIFPHWSNHTLFHCNMFHLFLWNLLLQLLCFTNKRL